MCYRKNAGQELRNLGPASKSKACTYDLTLIIGLLDSHSCHLYQTWAISLNIISNSEMQINTNKVRRLETHPKKGSS